MLFFSWSTQNNKCFRGFHCSRRHVVQMFNCLNVCLNCCSNFRFPIHRFSWCLKAPKLRRGAFIARSKFFTGAGRPSGSQKYPKTTSSFPTRWPILVHDSACWVPHSRKHPWVYIGTKAECSPNLDLQRENEYESRTSLGCASKHTHHVVIISHRAGNRGGRFSSWKTGYSSYCTGRQLRNVVTCSNLFP